MVFWLLNWIKIKSIIYFRITINENIEIDLLNQTIKINSGYS